MLREELKQSKTHLAQWHEAWKQAKQACEAWKREAEEAGLRAKMEKERVVTAMEEVGVCVWGRWGGGKVGVCRGGVECACLLHSCVVLWMCELVHGMMG